MEVCYVAVGDSDAFPLHKQGRLLRCCEHTKKLDARVGQEGETLGKGLRRKLNGFSMAKQDSLSAVTGVGHTAVRLFH